MELEELKRLERLIKVLRENGVTIYETPELSLSLTPLPASPSELDEREDSEFRNPMDAAFAHLGGRHVMKRQRYAKPE